MAVGFPVKDDYVTGDVLTAANMNDLSGTVNTLQGTQEAAGFAAGKNKIINGNFYINQRGFTSNTTDNTYNFDRWVQENSGGTVTVTPQTFTPGTAPVSGYEGKNFVRIVTASQSTAGHYALYEQRIEDVRTFAGQSITVSFWAKAASGTPNVGVTAIQTFGGGGSATVNTSAASVQAITTSWARYSFTIAIPSISGKTIGTAVNNMLTVAIVVSTGSTLVGLGYANTGIQNNTFDIWGVQAEAGSTATAFQTATGTIQGELAACQRYYTRLDGSAYTTFGAGRSNSATAGHIAVNLPVPMRTTPTAGFSTASGFIIWTGAGATTALTAIGLNQGSKTALLVDITTAASQTVGYGTILFANNSATTFIEASAEL